MTGRGPGDDLRSVIAARGADAVIVDCNLAGAAAAAEASGCRSAILLHSMYKTYVDTWFGELWPYLASAINDTRAVFGLDARESWTDIFRPTTASTPPCQRSSTRQRHSRHPRRCSTPASSSPRQTRPIDRPSSEGPTSTPCS